MFERLTNGWDLAKESWGVLREEKSLILFPLISGVACLVVLASFLIPVFSMVEQNGQILQNWDTNPWVYVGTFLFYFINYFIIVFFNSALVACAVIRFRGGDPTLGDGLSAATKRLPQITGWALISATVGVILRAIENHARFGEIVSAIVGTVWTLGTYFVVPVLVVEGLGPIDSVKRSMSVMKRTWGEALGANFGIGFMTFLLSIPGIAMMYGGFAMASALGSTIAVLGIVWIITMSLISSALDTILVAALYLYAADGEAPRQFDRRLLRNAFTA